MWLPSALLAPVLIVAAIPVETLSLLLAALLVLLISVLGYVSTSTRITSAKHALAAEEVVGYHSNLATILHLIPIGAPFTAGLLLSSMAGPIVFVIILSIALSFAVLLYRSVVRDHEDARAIESNVGVDNVTRRIRDASVHILDTPLLLQSVLVTSIVNFIGFANEYLAVRHVIDLDFGFSVWPSAPLMLSGFGAIVSAFFAQYIEKVNYKRTLWYCQTLAIVAMLSCYLSSNTVVFCVALILNGAVGATAAATAWSVRLRLATRANIGVIAGVTSSLYKVHSLLFLPLVGNVAGANGVLIGGLFVSAVALASLAFFSLIPGVDRSGRYLIDTRVVWSLQP